MGQQGSGLYRHPEVYDALYSRKEYRAETEFVVEQFERLGNGGDRALVVGCGTGGHSPFLREAGFDVLGVDPSEPMLERARGKSDAEFRRGRLPDLEVDGEFDLVFLPYTVVDYLDPGAYAASVERIRSLLADGGVLVLDASDFPHMRAPSLDVVPAPGGDAFARLFQTKHLDDERLVSDTVVLGPDDPIIDRQMMTRYSDEQLVAPLDDHGFDHETHGWYGGAFTFMRDPTVVVATLPE